MERPIIGITSSLSAEAQVLGCRYVDAVERAGGSPLILPMTAMRETLRPVVARIDGLMITGGPGITQGLIGELPEDLPPVDERRWQADCWTFEMVQEQQKPVLGICYGMQFINARLGGRIYADAQRQLQVEPHSPKRSKGEAVRHQVKLVSDTVLAGLAGVGCAEVNSSHIQAVEEIGEGLRVSARSDDGLVEGIETEDGRLIGVQFHPEGMPDTVWERLFEHLAERAVEGGTFRSSASTLADDGSPPAPGGSLRGGSR